MGGWNTDGADGTGFHGFLLIDLGGFVSPPTGLITLCLYPGAAPLVEVCVPLSRGCTLG